jgi:23S rRNA (cytosine1962-C5)-methyltransferase
VLHLFAYTGALTLVAARAGAEVSHVDAVRDVNDWARRNAESSGLGDASIRWITDDAVKFAQREIRRGRRYDAVILDPPTYGRGPKGEKWILERDLAGLSDLLMQLAAPEPAFVVFTAHNPGFSPPLMRNMLAPWAARFGGSIEDGTMILRSPRLRCVLPAGFFARWSAG